MKRYACQLLTSAAVASLLPAHAWAAQPGPQAEGSAVGEVVVTAQKREQKLQSVPGSISALGAEQLKQAGINNVQDLANRVPGLDFGQQNGAAFVTLRGVGLAVDTGVAEPNIAIHVDGVFLPRTTMETLDVLDLERVEVLRGPQGTLYGRNATGGAINFISRAPSRTFGGEGQIVLGNYEAFEARAVASGPISENVRVRLSAGYGRRGDGYVDNAFTGGDFDKNERYNVRGAVAADITSALSADLSVAYGRERFQTYQQLVKPPGPLGPFIFPPLATAVSPYSPWTTGGDYNPWSSRSTLLVRGGLNWAITPDISLRSITGYINHTFTNRIDGDGTSSPYIVIRDREQPSESISQELNLGGPLPRGGSWLVGGYVFHEDFSSSIPVVLPSGLPAFQLPPESTLLSEVSEKTTSLAAFADVTIGITDRLRLYGGARLSKDDKDFLQSAGAIIPGVPAALTLTCNNQASSQSFESFSPRAGVQFDIMSGVMAYAQYSKGFKSGGLNSSACGDTYDPEELEATEVGIKSQFLNRRATLNASLFHYDYSGLQVFKIVGLNAVIENADARTYGADVEGRLQLSDNLRVDASGTFLDAEFTNFLSADPANPSAGVQDLKGKRLPRAPKYLVNLGLEGEFPIALGPFSRLTLRTDVRWSGSLYFQPFNTPGYEQDAYATFNAFAILAAPGQGYTIRAYGRNLGNEAVLGHAFYNTIQDAYLGNYLPPRTFGVEFRKTF